MPACPDIRTSGSLRERGFTLLETVVVLGVVATLAGLATPMTQDLLDAHQSNVSANDFVLALRLARSAAAKRNHRVVVCKSSGSGCSQTGAWDQGWLVFEDRNNNAMFDPGEDVLHQAPALKRGIRLRGNSPVDDYVSFTPTGRMRSASNALQMGTISLCKPGSAMRSRDIVINNSGRVNLVSPGTTPCLA